jgi:hypothetical protein
MLAFVVGLGFVRWSVWGPNQKPVHRVLLAIEILIPGIAILIDTSECMYAY